MLADERPTTAFVLSLLGGVFILLNGVLWLALPWNARDLYFACGLTAILLGVLVVLGGVMLYANPAHRVAWGAIVAAFSLVSLATGGGLIVGMMLGLIGGILGAVWKPRVAPQEPRWFPQAYGQQGIYPPAKAYTQPAARYYAPPKSHPGLGGYQPQDEDARRLYTKLTSKAMDVRFCTRCGTLNIPSARFCTSCGSRL